MLIDRVRLVFVDAQHAVASNLAVFELVEITDLSRAESLSGGLLALAGAYRCHQHRNGWRNIREHIERLGAPNAFDHFRNFCQFAKRQTRLHAAYRTLNRGCRGQLKTSLATKQVL